MTDAMLGKKNAVVEQKAVAALQREESEREARTHREGIYILVTQSLL